MASSSSKTPTTAAPTNNNTPKSPESHESLSRRNAAAEILQSYEKLSWYSFQRCESLPQTRLHFQNIIAGFTDADEAALVDWKEDRTPRAKTVGEGVEGKSGKGKEKGKEKEKERGGSAGEGSSTAGPGKSGKGGEGGSSAGGSAGGSGSKRKKRRSGGG